MARAEKDYMGTRIPEFTTYGERNYGRHVGERGHHVNTGDSQVVEVVALSVMDNNSARYRYIGGERDGVEFTATAEHFDPIESSPQQVDTTD